MLTIGANRAIDLIVTKEQGGGRFGASGPGRPLGDHPDGGAIDVTAELPTHFAESLANLGFEESLGNSMPADTRPRAASFRE